MTEEERAAATAQPERKELTPEERDAAVEAFFAKKRAQIEGREAIPGAEKMGDEGRAYWMGLMGGAAEGESKGVMKAGTGFMGGVLGEAVKAGKVVQLPAQLMGYDRLHKYLTGLQEDWEKWRQNEYGLGYEDWGTKLGDVGDKMAETAGSMGVISAEKGAAKYIAGLSAFSDTWQKARDKGQSWGRSLAEAGASGVIHFLGWKAFENKSLNALFKIPWLQKTRTGKIVQEWLKEGDGSGFSGLVRKVRNGSIAGVLVERGLGAVKAGSIFGVQEAASSMVDQFAEQNVKPLEEWTDEELKAKLAEWEAYERGDKDALKPAEGRDLGDMLGVALKAGLQGAAQGAALEATMGAGELALTTAEAREQTALAVKKLLQDEKGRGWIGSRNPEAMGVVQKIALEGGKVTPELLDAAGLPPDLEMRDVRRLAFDLRRDVEMADTRREMATEAYRKREELAERFIEAHKKGETYEFESEEQKQEMELALKERDERIAEREADAMVDAAQGMADTLFGKETGILVRRGTAEESMRAAKAALGENADVAQLKNAAGEFMGYWDRKAGEVVLFRGADVSTVAHELGWHATRNWAEKNAPELLAKMRQYAENAPEELKAEIERLYPDAKGDYLLDEIGAARFDRTLGERFKEMMERSPEAKSWWQGLKDMIAEAWHGMVRGLKGGKVEGLKGRGIDWAQLEGMKPEEGMEWLVEKMASGERIAGEGQGFDFASRGGTAQPGSTKAIRPQIAGKRGAENLGVTKMGEAEKMENEGASREDIWRKTGWWRGKDGKWRVELPDVKMKNERELFAALVENSNDTTLGRIMDAPELFKAYPQLKDTRIILSPEEVNPGEPGGWYDRVKNEITLLDAGLISWRDRPARERDLLDHYNRMVDSDEYRKNAIEKMDSFGIEHGTDAEEREYARQWVDRFSKGINRTNETRIRDLANDRSMRSVFGKIVHEVQHAIQRIEGFAGGASGKEEGYSRFTGEVEARNAARREAMTPDQRAATPPWATEDVAEESQIIRYSRKLKPEERPETKTVGEKITAIVGGSLKRRDGAITYKESETDARRLAAEAKKVYEKYAKREYKLPTGGVLYFQPDARTVEAYGGDEAAAWGEYALHLITHTRGSGEERYRSFDGRSIDIVLPNIEEIIKADKVKESEGRIIFYKQTKKAESKTKSRYAYLVTEPDEDGNLRVDLRYITGMQDRGFLPGDTATLKEVISDRTAEGHALHQDQTGANYSTGGEAAQGGSAKQAKERKVTPEEDAAYEEAVKRGDMETVRRMEREVYERMGYSDDSGYQGTSAFNGPAPSRNAYFETKAERIEATKNGEMEDTTTLGDFRDGIDVNNLQFIVFDPRSEKNADTKRQEAIRNIRGVLEDGKDTITMYRSVPADVKEGQFRNGDWITPSRAYAEENARIHGWEKSRIIEQEVSVEDVWWDGNDIAEWGFDDGKGSVYKNTLANRKLLGPTYDDAGNLIPLSKRFNDWKQDIRYQRRLTDAEERERTAEALKAVREGRVRVADNGGAPGEANEPGMAASEELQRAQAGAVAPSDMPELEGGARPVALSQSQMVALFRAVRACPSLPRVLQEAKRKGAAWVSRITKGSDVELNPEAFGIIDRTDRERVKSEMVAEGRFRHEDPVWNMKHSKAQCEKEREISETLLEDRLRTLAEDRVRGRKAGGGRAAANALAHEIGQLVMALPVSERVRTAAGKDGAAALKDLRTIGQGLMKALEKEWGEVKGDMDDPALIGSHLAEAVETVAWWRGVTKDQAAYEQIAREKGEEGLKAAEEEEKRIKTGLSRDHKGLAGELFGMFLAAPETLRERAPRSFNRIVEAMGANDALLEAYGRIATADAPTEVMAKIREQWTHEAQTELRKLEREVDAPLGGFIARAKRRMILNLHSTEGAVVSIVDDALAERVAAAKRAVKAAKRGGDRKEIARAEANLVQVRNDAKAALAELKVGVLKKQRGGGMERSYAENMLTRVFGDIERDGVDLEDLRAYMKAKWNIALQGRADSYGLTPQEAQRALEGLKRKLGDDGYAALERTQKRFYDVRRKEILDNPEVEAAFGSALVDYWRSNTDYVRSERILGREQAAAYKAAREEWLKRNPGQADVLGDIELMVEMHRLRHGGSDGSVFAKPLEGSFKATGDPLAYTLANDMHILQFARRNALMIQVADLAKELRMEGFKEVSDAGLGRALEGSRRYGSVAFMRDGERKLLIMPKVAAEGLGTMARSDVAGLVKANRWVSAILTQYSPRFAVRNVFRNRAGAEINVPWLRESKLLTGARFAGLGPMARLAEMLMERAAVRLPDGAVRNGLTRLVWGENTTMYWIGEATRIAKLMFDPKGIRNLAERADEAAANGDLAAAQAILEEITKARDLMKKPIFAGQWRMMMGQAESADLDSVFRALDMRTNLEGTSFTGLRKAARAAKDLADTVKRFNTFEEARIKIVAELAAERARNNAEAKGKEWRYSQNEVDYITATMAGSPRYEMRGRWMNVLEAIPLGPFANVAMKGALRTIESMRMDPKAWWTKAAPRVAGRMAEIALWGAGGCALVAAMARRLFGDNEEAQAAIDGFENFGKRMARARACVSDYRLRNYDIVPMGLYGKWASFGINMPRGDEDRLIMPLTDTVGRFLATTDAAKRAGLHDPIDGAYTVPEAAVGTFMGSGLAPDITRGSMIWNLGKDLLYAWLQNPYNTFTQRPTYGQAVWENRFKSWSNAGDFFEATLKQAWNDVGGQVVLPATTWDEDEGNVPDEGKWVLGMADPKEAAAMPVGGRTIFRALHYVPMASSMLSGLFYMNCDGDARIARRLAKMQEKEKALRDHVAMKCLAMQLKNWDVAVDYSKILDAAIAENGWDEMDRALIEQALVRKLKAAAKKMGRENVPILDVFNKTMSERERAGMERYLTGIGWEME